MFEIAPEHKKGLYGAALTLLIVLSLFFAMKFLSELKAYGTAGSGNVNTITLTGYGEVTAVPDIASISFTIEKEAKTTKDAQDQVAVVEKNVLNFLRENKIADKDFKTSGVSLYPKYEYQYDTTTIMPCTEFGCPPRPGRNVVVGYVVSESLTVKIRNTDEVGKIMQRLGELGVSQLNGPNFSIDDENALKAEARRKAITDARSKATGLAKDLGVRLGKVVTFSEADYGFPIYARTAIMESGMGGDMVKTPPAEIPKGENIVSSNVSITYEIR
jgi:uncharacterized protein